MGPTKVRVDAARNLFEFDGVCDAGGVGRVEGVGGTMSVNDDILFGPRFMRQLRHGRRPLDAGPAQEKVGRLELVEGTEGGGVGLAVAVEFDAVDEVRARGKRKVAQNEGVLHLCHGERENAIAYLGHPPQHP